jgi:hypothetical protein
MKTKHYPMGSDNFKWNLTIAVDQKRDSYKYVFFDNEDDQYIATDCWTAATVNALDRTIENILARPERMESLSDFNKMLMNTFYCPLFFHGNIYAPRLQDGVLLLAARE